MGLPPSGRSKPVADGAPGTSVHVAGWSVGERCRRAPLDDSHLSLRIPGAPKVERMNSGRRSHTPKPAAPSGLRNQLPQHEGEDPAVLVIIDLDRGVDPATHRHILHGPTLAGDPQSHVLLRLQ